MRQQLSPNTATVTNPAPSARLWEENKRELGIEFAKRLREAFDGASNADIARRLDTTDAAITRYMNATGFPLYEMLLRITRVTGCNLHWLVTGNGANRVGKAAAMFSKDEESTIREMAARSGRTFEEQVRVLVVAAVEMVGKV